MHTLLKAVSTMNETPETSLLGKSRPPGLFAAAAGGFISVLIWTLGWGLLRWQSSEYVLFSATTSWLVFPIGATLGYALPRWTFKRGWGAVMAMGLFGGLGIGLFLAVGVWLCLSLSIAVISHALQGRATINSPPVWPWIGHVPWLTASVITCWVFGAKIFSKGRVEKPASTKLTTPLRPFFGGYLSGAMAGVAGIFALAALVSSISAAWLVKGASFTVENFATLLLYDTGLTLLGPLFPLICFSDPSRGVGIGLAVAIPVMLAAIAPFILTAKPVRPKVAIIAWCGLTTAFFFWVAMGINSSLAYIG